ncbi:family 5 extracellular solute-binding protein [Halosimplex carlsbadense 2-9-1]|uniref:Family 5 extracellular solute-binding protein n=1 Tax=Halosimplex carlsbadense 2-9-1 TaxID=797114 RepID=M0CNJ3_9EURY|nr:ABC transporter substrate-binding protein [Halosimplex carlsbadense]ELZ24198.1 family 5 extracellular solute-binding protein [Halosimplex carlsbadense 2-9-1]
MDPRSEGRAGDDPVDGTTRRGYLAAVAAGVAGSIAGCTGPNEIVDSPQVFGFQFPYVPENVHVGPWSSSDPAAFYSILFEAESYTTPGGERRLGDVIESVETDGDTATVAYADGYTWWSGDPVTARDAWIEERIGSYVSGDRSYEVERLDDSKLRYRFDRPLDRPLALSTAAGGAVRTRADRYEPWLDRLRDAGTDERRSEVVSELRTDSPDLETVADEGLGCGPFELVEVSINRLMLERYEDHPRADEVAVPRLWFPVVQSVSIENLVSKGWLDGGTGRLGDERGTPPGNLEQLARYPTDAGTKLVLDWRDPHLGRRPVRRAVLSVIPVDQVVDVTDWGDPTVRQTGLSAPAARRWLPDEVRERLHRYPVEADEETAAEYMREAGYSRDGNGDWRGPDGEQPSPQLATPVWSDFVSGAEVVASSLSQFGFDVTTDRLTNSNVYAAVSNHTHDITLWNFDGDPYSAYDVTSDGSTSIGYGVSDSGADAGSRGKPVEVSVPQQPGAVDAPASERRTVDLLETWRTIEGPSDRAATVDAIATFATWWNDALPDIYLGTTVDGLWGNTRDFEWPSYDAEPEYGTAGPAGQPVFHMLKHGAIRPVTEE